ncbi:MAG: NYN domain-containing protein [Faecalibacterium prausnitzii]
MAEKSEKQLVVGILAHVDSGKTTLSEAMLYRSGSIRKLGRVDNKDAFLDTDMLEKARGITIFSKQALLKTGSTNITLLDTPGHVDFSTETERTLQVLDYAVLVISGTDGVQSHTETLWRLLRRYHIPTFVFINKMDLPGPGKEALLSQLSHRLGDGFVDFGAEQAERDEALALCDERLMEKMLDAGSLTAEDIIPAIARRHVFPCWFGVALQRENAGGLQGVDELLAGLDEYTRAAPALEAFGARVFKVSQDERGERLTWLRVTGGELKVKAQLTGEADGEPWAEKANQLRLYSGAKYTLAEAIGPGQVCAVTGLTRAKPGTGLGAERDSDLPVLEPVLSYRVCLPEGADVHAALGKLHRLEEEEPQLHVVWNETLGEIHVQLMGEIQLEVLKSLLAERYGLDVEFDSGGILYKETITEAIEGVGHYEPLRHYAEVHLKLEPLPRGSGMQFAVNCREEELDKNWQRLVLTHLEEKQHLGVLIGTPLTDMKITLIAGRAHLKIFERTYGPIKRDPLAAFRPVQKRERPDFAAEQWEIAPEYLLVDGYNIIFAWDELNALSKESLDAARHRLMDILCNYQGFKKCVLILVFDAYRVPGSPGSIEQYHNIHVVYTKEAETADMFIERVTHEIGKNRRVRVATSDGMEQVIILGHGALRVSARMFHEEVQDVEKEIRRCIQGEA